MDGRRTAGRQFRARISSLTLTAGEGVGQDGEDARARRINHGTGDRRASSARDNDARPLAVRPGPVE